MERSASKMFYFTLLCALIVGSQLPQCRAQGQNNNLELNYDIGNVKYIERGKDLILICKNKINTEYPSWLYPKVPQDRLTIDHGINSTLRVKNASDEITGTYKCSVDYTKPDKTTVRIENSINVVSSPLTSSEPSDTNIEITEGETLTLQCFIEGGVPNPKFQNWQIQHENTSLTRNAKPYDDYDGYSEYHTVSSSTERWLLQDNTNGQPNGKFVIKPVKLDDSGNYTCSAANDIGNDKKVFNVKVKEPPTTTTQTTTTTTQTTATTTQTTTIVTNSTSPASVNSYGSVWGETTEKSGKTCPPEKPIEKPGEKMSEEGDGGLGGGAIAGIIIGVLAAVGSVIAAFFVWSKRQKSG